MKVTQEMIDAFKAAWNVADEAANYGHRSEAGLRAVLDLIAEREAKRVAATVTELNGIDASDPEEAHGNADGVLLRFVPREVAEAWDALATRAGGFWYA